MTGAVSRYVIIGAGAAGIAAAEAIRRLDAAGEILLLCEERQGYYSRPGLAYYLTGEIPERQLYPYAEEDYRRQGFQRLFARAVRILPDQHQVALHDGTRVPYDRLLIATGARAAFIDLPGCDAQGVFKLDTLADAQQIRHMARKARSAVVVGGGITALEIVEGLIASGVKTHYFLRGDRYWGNVLDEAESRIVERRLREEGVQIHYKTELAEILVARGRVAAARTRDGRVIKCSLLGVAIGVQPRKELAQASGIHTDRGIVVDEFLQTSAPDVFAAGDAAQVFDPFTGKGVLHTLWGPARQQGAAAGANMAGKRMPFLHFTPFNVTRLANLTTTIIGPVGGGKDLDLFGIARGDSETWRQIPDAIAAQSDVGVHRLRLLVGERTLVGAIVMGDQKLSRPIHQMISNCADITPIREALLRPGAPLADLIAGYWTLVNSKTPYATHQP